MRRIRHALCCWACLVCYKLLNCYGLDVVLMAISSLENNLTDVQYGHNKARWFLPFSVDNKLRYCHFNHLSCVFGGDFQKKEKDDRFKLSSRFAKLYWIQHLLTRTRTKQRRKPSRIAYLDLDTVITSPKSKIFPPSMANFSILMVKCSPLSTGECVESHAPTVDSRYQTGVIYLTNDQHSKQLFVDGVHSHMKTTNEVSSDQLFLNELLLTSAAAADNTNSNKNRSKNRSKNKQKQHKLDSSKDSNKAKEARRQTRSSSRPAASKKTSKKASKQVQ